MGYYEDALEWQGTAIDLEACGRYRGSIYMSCLAVECFLKSKIETFEPNNARLKEHDTIYLYRLLKSKYPPRKDLITDIRLCRKYHSDARYSNTANTEVYTKDFASRFIQIVADVKWYIDNDCALSLEDLVKKYMTIQLTHDNRFCR